MSSWFIFIFKMYKTVKSMSKIENQKLLIKCRTEEFRKRKKVFTLFCNTGRRRAPFHFCRIYLNIFIVRYGLWITSKKPTKTLYNLVHFQYQFAGKRWKFVFAKFESDFLIFANERMFTVDITQIGRRTNWPYTRRTCLERSKCDSTRKYSYFVAYLNPSCKVLVFFIPWWWL